MDIPKKYFHDRSILLLLSVSAFLVLFIAISIVLRLDTSQDSGYIVQYRSNMGLNAFKVGGLADIMSFVVFSAAVAVFHFFVSIKMYTQRRHLSIVFLGLGLLLLLLALIVSNALLILR